MKEDASREDNKSEGDSVINVVNWATLCFTVKTREYVGPAERKVTEQKNAKLERSASYATINEWNNLPEEIVNSLNVNEFKSRLQPLLGKYRDTTIGQRRLPVPFLTASEK